MVNLVRLAKRAEKSLERAPRAVVDEAATWQGLIEEHGIEVVRMLPYFRDHSLKGKLKRSGIRSVSLSYGYRLFYRIFMDQVECVLVEEVNNHDYRSIERLFGG